jgi:hypothetical protein
MSCSPTSEVSDGEATRDTTALEDDFDMGIDAGSGKSSHVEVEQAGTRRSRETC